MRSWRLWVVAVVVMVAGGATGTEAAIVFPFEGHGTSSGAAAPAPLTWDVVADVDLGGGVTADFWTTAFLPWPSSTSVTDFHVSFTSRTINDDLDLVVRTAFAHFDSTAGFIRWTPVITNGQDSSSVDFFAPPGVSLDQGEFSTAQVRWVTDASAVRDFTAHWTTSSVPEPTSLTLLGPGLVALYAVRRRRV